jgi:hypothetical protein
LDGITGKTILSNNMRRLITTTTQRPLPRQVEDHSFYAGRDRHGTPRGQHESAYQISAKSSPDKAIDTFSTGVARRLKPVLSTLLARRTHLAGPRREPYLSFTRFDNFRFA